jgi:hypothetical protein
MYASSIIRLVVTNWLGHELYCTFGGTIPMYFLDGSDFLDPEQLSLFSQSSEDEVGVFLNESSDHHKLKSVQKCN